MTRSQAQSVVLTVDLLALLARIDKLDEKVKSLQEEVQANFDYAVNNMPTLAENGVKLKVLTDEESVEVVVQKVA